MIQTNLDMIVIMRRVDFYIQCTIRDIGLLKGKAVPLQAWSGPECSRKLRFPACVTTAQDGGKVVSLRYRPTGYLI
jgi:hypothetical protein